MFLGINANEYQELSLNLLIAIYLLRCLKGSTDHALCHTAR
ncbi:Uncharacterised protein [Chlamydia abortus]|nr:Uncharacterised protein [Chlamydia abortus]